MVENAKKEGLYKTMWGPHAHITEVLDWDPSPGEVKRYMKFMKKSTNYNASLTCTDVHGFFDLNESITICKPSGDYICNMTGREILTSLFKFKNGKPFIAEVHQQHNQGVVTIVHQNNPEGETLATSLQKQPAAFALGHLSDQKVNQYFIDEFLETFIDPALIHDAPQCTWNSDTQTLLTAAALHEDENAGTLEEQEWWTDVVQQYEDLKGKSGKMKQYAAQRVIFDLDGSMSITTMHEKIDSAGAVRSDKHARVTFALNKHSPTDEDKDDSSEEQGATNKDPDNSEEESGSENEDDRSEDRGGRRSGDTPISVEVRSDRDRARQEMTEDTVSLDDASTASAAGDSDGQTGTPG